MSASSIKSAALSTILIILVNLSLFANPVDTEDARVGIWTMDYEAALALAADKDLPLLLNFTGSDWCGWCKLMDKSVFSQAEWQAYAKENVVLVTIDFPRDKSIVPDKFVAQNNQLKQQFGITGFPTYIIVNSDGKEVLGKLGAGRNKTPQIFISELQELLKYRDAEVEKFVKNLPEAQGAAYKEAVASLKSRKDELMQWISTRPIRNAENEKIFNDYLAQISEAEAEIEELEKLILQ